MINSVCKNKILRSKEKESHESERTKGAEIPPEGFHVGRMLSEQFFCTEASRPFTFGHVFVPPAWHIQLRKSGTFRHIRAHSGTFGEKALCQKAFSWWENVKRQAHSAEPPQAIIILRGESGKETQNVGRYAPRIATQLF